MKVPCKNCPDRTPLCHGICPQYKAYVAENNRVRKARASDPYRLATGYEIMQIHKFFAATARR